MPCRRTWPYTWDCNTTADWIPHRRLNTSQRCLLVWHGWNFCLVSNSTSGVILKHQSQASTRRLDVTSDNQPPSSLPHSCQPAALHKIWNKVQSFLATTGTQLKPRIMSFSTIIVPRCVLKKLRANIKIELKVCSSCKLRPERITTTTQPLSKVVLNRWSINALLTKLATSNTLTSVPFHHVNNEA